jgi:LPXTG-motif cell wall-anchored protein
VRGLLVAVALGLVVLFGGPAAHAAEAEYPPGSPGNGILSRPAQPGPEGILPRTGNDMSHELALGAGLLVTGGAILVATRRRRALYG